ncbi:lipocalin family protein [Mucilaginibacter sp. KACC 22063]|uniref:lipocalin family protein n=1 Tax=Mucilaginibacter sp. KACC 22063 TaxID=3025666 RepID=UPI0023661E73|nr:lipocalin family protein [Mucilaginibacter sp. KACC 22063]WDF53931.1 lipocalin family protein [Mucilaginibacter sp. KACC 22063]
MKNKLYLLAGLAGAAAIAVSLSSCVSIPHGAKAVSPFNQQKYLGTWYEIARMDFKFEKGLERVTATYTLNDDRSIRVKNRGYKTKDQEWKQSIGKAKLVGDPTEGRLKVSFFGPFYAGYNVIAIDPDYKYALIAGNNLKYLWLLSREKTMPDYIKQRYLAHAKALGYDTEKLVWTDQHADGND